MLLSWLAAASAAAAATFLAEFGDKSQLLAAGMTARLGRRKVLLGVALGIVLVQVLAVVVGAAVGQVLPERPIGVLAGALFVLVGAWLWWDTRHPDEPADDAAPGEADDAALGTPPADLRQGVATGSMRAAVTTVALTFALGEMGDKTQVATVALASRQDPVPTFVGASLGMLAAIWVAVEVGSRVSRVLPQRTVLRASAVLFVVVGVTVATLALL